MGYVVQQNWTFYFVYHQVGLKFFKELKKNPMFFISFQPHTGLWSGPRPSGPPFAWHRPGWWSHRWAEHNKVSDGSYRWDNEEEELMFITDPESVLTCCMSCDSMWGIQERLVINSFIVLIASGTHLISVSSSFTQNSDFISVISLIYSIPVVAPSPPAHTQEVMCLKQEADRLSEHNWDENLHLMFEDFKTGESCCSSHFKEIKNKINKTEKWQVHIFPPQN